jgi:triosephosphate isomerase
MNKYVIAGNWKMNNDLKESIALVSEIKSSLQKKENVDVILCPPFTSLETASALLKDSYIKLGAQNMYYEDSGAFTGEISAKMLKSVGCEYVILGHSERRTIFKETDEIVNKKIKKALSEKLKVIFCIGETLEEREKGITNSILEKQLKNGLQDITSSQMDELIVAYEPVWAIGTGKTATPMQAEEAHKFIRSVISEIFSDSVAENIVIQYGGSVKPDNAKELMSQKNINGALVGGACLKSKSFLEIINAVN